MSVYTLADTALLTHGKPMFVPDYGSCTAVGCVVARISRMGKSMPERFAQRYFDALTVGVRFELDGLRRELTRQGLLCDAAVSFDGAAVIGGFVETTDFTEHGCRIELETGGRNAVSGSFPNLLCAVAHAVAYAAQYYTIRQGDVLFFPISDEKLAALPNTHFEGRINGDRVLGFNVK